MMSLSCEARSMPFVLHLMVLMKNGFWILVVLITFVTVGSSFIVTLIQMAQFC